MGGWISSSIVSKEVAPDMLVTNSGVEESFLMEEGRKISFYLA